MEITQRDELIIKCLEYLLEKMDSSDRKGKDKITDIVLGNKPFGNSVRFNILRRDGFKCVYCGAKAFNGAELQVDHIFPVSLGGSNSESNLITSCKECNQGKKAKLLNEAEVHNLLKDNRLDGE